LEERLAALSAGTADAGRAGDGDEWPDAGEESAYLSEAGGRAAAQALPAERTPAAQEKLPALDDLVARVPANIRAVLDDLFRAKFTGVRRMPPETTRS